MTDKSRSRQEFAGHLTHAMGSVADDTIADLPTNVTPNKRPRA
jgi:hypothetical protein